MQIIEVRSSAFGLLHESHGRFWEERKSLMKERCRTSYETEVRAPSPTRPRPHDVMTENVSNKSKKEMN
jgi:hypothetical protein